MKKLIIVFIVLILVNITSTYFLSRRENLYMNNRDDNSFSMPTKNLVMQKVYLMKYIITEITKI